MRLQLLVTFLVVFELAPTVRAQDTISADRPGITLSPTVVPPGTFQIEAGIPQYTAMRGNGVDAELWSLPVQLRYGLTPSVELRLAGSPWNRLHDDVSGDDVDGASDVELGTKIVLSDGESGPKLAAILGVRLPVGSEDFTAHQPGYTFNLAASMAFDPSNTLTGLAGISRIPVGDENATTGALGLALTHSFTDAPFSAYIEAGWFPNIDNSVDTAVAGTGATYLVTNDLQLDAFGDFGLNEDTPDATIGLGISWRW